jgi:hypothetical protein
MAIDLQKQHTDLVIGKELFHNYVCWSLNRPMVHMRCFWQLKIVDAKVNWLGFVRSIITPFTLPFSHAYINSNKPVVFEKILF